MGLPDVTKKRIVSIVVGQVLREFEQQPLTQIPNSVIADKIVSIMDDIETTVDSVIHSQKIEQDKQTAKKPNHRWWE